MVHRDRGRQHDREPQDDGEMIQTADAGRKIGNRRIRIITLRNQRRIASRAKSGVDERNHQQDQESAGHPNERTSTERSPDTRTRLVSRLAVMPLWKADDGLQQQDEQPGHHRNEQVAPRTAVQPSQGGNDRNHDKDGNVIAEKRHAQSPFRRRLPPSPCQPAFRGQTAGTRRFRRKAPRPPPSLLRARSPRTP